ncbi:MAG: DUF1800 domain-containing protein [Paracoccaceae bacterium]
MSEDAYFDPDLADIRFGCGRAPDIAAPRSIAQMMERLRGPDLAARAFPIGSFDSLRQDLTAYDGLRNKERELSRELANTGPQDSSTPQDSPTRQERTAAFKRIQKQVEVQKRAARLREVQSFGHTLQRRIGTQDGLRERLVAFWADHFTAHAKRPRLRPADATYIEDAIRPHVAGRFADMLRAAATHPVMLFYLDQHVSVGPNSPAARARVSAGRPSGAMNENLAREMLELHTLGVGGPYGQGDVQQLAALLTGLSYAPAKGFVFRAGLAEPQAETVLGKRYGGAKAKLDDIYAALDDLAAHPATSRHIARKMARHFTSDQPSEDLIRALDAAFTQSGGDLAALTQALLRHPDAWVREPGNVKQPFDFVASALRALGTHPRHIPVMKRRRMQQQFLTPLAHMGQAWNRPPGPDGWPEEDAAWIVPQRLAARIQWAMTVPFALMKLLPDPDDFMRSALGARARSAPQLGFAAKGAETRAIGIGLVLLSPAFQRM